MLELKGYITNLGKYNEGFLIGEWITFPIDEDELSAVFKRIGISDEPDEEGNYYDEYFFTDWDDEFGLDLGEYENVSALNEKIESYEGLSRDDRDAFEAIIESGESYDTAIDTIEHYEYVLYNSGDIDDIARDYADDEIACWVDKKAIKFVERYFDYDSYIDDWKEDRTYYEGDHKTVVVY